MCNTRFSVVCAQGSFFKNMQQFLCRSPSCPLFQKEEKEIVSINESVPSYNVNHCTQRKMVTRMVINSKISGTFFFSEAEEPLLRAVPAPSATKAGHFLDLPSQVCAHTSGVHGGKNAFAACVERLNVGPLQSCSRSQFHEIASKIQNMYSR